MSCELFNLKNFVLSLLMWICVTDITCVCCELTHDLNVAIFALQIIDGAHVVKSSTSNHVPWRCVWTGHHPWGLQGDGMNLHHSQNRHLNNYIYSHHNCEHFLLIWQWVSAVKKKTFTFSLYVISIRLLPFAHKFDHWQVLIFLIAVTRNNLHLNAHNSSLKQNLVWCSDWFCGL